MWHSRLGCGLCVQSPFTPICFCLLLHVLGGKLRVALQGLMMRQMRKLFSSIVLVILTATFARPTLAQAPSTANLGLVCLFDAERGEVPDCIRHTADGKLFIAPQYVKELNFNSAGLAPVWAQAQGWTYVNRKGAVVITGVPTFDNWADDFSDGLVRTVVSGRYGFANRQGRIVIRPAYDWASPFEGGYAQVCNRCQAMCATPGGVVEERSLPHGCEHSFMAGGEWFKIDKKGRVVARLPHTDRP